MQRGLLREEQVRPVQGKISVHLVGGHLVVPLHLILPADVQQHLRAHHIGLQKYPGILDGAVHMTLGGEVHHHIRAQAGEGLLHGGAVRDVRLDKSELWIIHHRSQRLQVACIGQFVHADEFVIGMRLAHMEHKVAADKAGAAGNQ